MAVPAKKVSRSRRGMRRAHQRDVSAVLAGCPNCGALRRSHHICDSCGHYRGREVVAMPQPDEEEDET